ncbi:MAG: hypothetical protein GWM92_09550 [Gemmatimonadetes bacterium]|nr:P-II family nitrogen regulator [Gemmatimonadota bacterium]NIR78907.1 P-II family nitrogen regulator [Gemmatimonadota bacterium]NIT87542.1 P-II family nitrogen regulator [Gemmatimonadota bacterium]NIU31410.1 P-II family nitrogen regulator [Gemmatimonadota bacterium]NIU36095.1 hypothetical protein [Gemmatimonadota bacterium]
MGMIREIKAYVRSDCVSDVLRALRRVGGSRFYLSHVHAVGAGIDPDELRISLEEGSSYMEKVKLEILCEAEQAEALVEAIRDTACTGHRGDGVVVVGTVEETVNIRTGDRDDLALL